MKIIICIAVFGGILLADTLPLPQLNSQTGKWEYVNDGKASKPKRLSAESDDKQKGLPHNLFDNQSGVSAAEYGRLARISVSIDGGTMEFFGKKRKYAPIQKSIAIGESGSIKVYCAESSCRDFAPELLYYSYQVNSGSPELFLDAVANEPIRIKIDNSILEQNKVVGGISVKPRNSQLKPSNITVQIFKAK
jgi:hypothetical protein